MDVEKEAASSLNVSRSVWLAHFAWLKISNNLHPKAQLIYLSVEMSPESMRPLGIDGSIIKVGQIGQAGIHFRPPPHSSKSLISHQKSLML